MDADECLLRAWAAATKTFSFRRISIRANKSKSRRSTNLEKKFSFSSSKTEKNENEPLLMMSCSCGRKFKSKANFDHKPGEICRRKYFSRKKMFGGNFSRTGNSISKSRRFPASQSQKTFIAARSFSFSNNSTINFVL